LTSSKEPDVEFSFDLVREIKPKREFTRATQESSGNAQAHDQTESEADQYELAIVAGGESLEASCCR
jgi:hypothetical protein